MPYADFARRAQETVIAAEREAHSGGQLGVGTLQLKPIGLAHTPYSDRAPRQPCKQAKGNFYVELFPELTAGLAGLDAFSHIYVISCLHRSSGYSLTVTPPWQESETRRTVGLFASRSPNRPSSELSDLLRCGECRRSGSWLAWRARMALHPSQARDGYRWLSKP